MSCSAPGRIAGEGRAACIAFYRRWLDEFPDAHLEAQETQASVTLMFDRLVMLEQLGLVRDADCAS